ncbi:Zn(2)-C6 fungal-type transcriptional factor [Mycena venus]|uniref:Zn(2)-C6 fungal-type transcriptional factor n=1 Tax=Mycena venus TaxID=2733690 RepID=A0A8H6YIR5_9AGAR|nr:Zn(2)-C6 fungal-type transcriptional factor [Mycena venus]
MSVNRNFAPHSQETIQRKKPPACDSCKARRVLCHPTRDRTPCPRCLEKGIRCTTTPVARGRPPKSNLGVVPPRVPRVRSGPTMASAISLGEVKARPSDSVSASVSDSASTSSSSLDFSGHPELTPELVYHLFECFTHLSHHHHPMFCGDVLRKSLASVSWNIHRIPPQLRVLAHCVLALSASISFNNAIIGPGSTPASLVDRSVFTRGADLRDYGVRRTPTYRLLCAEALRLASKTDILLEPTEVNAISCFLLQLLDNEKPSRPYSVAYLSHVRSLCGSWDEDTVSQNATIWTGFLVMEVVHSILRRQPILVSYYDQLLITGREPLSLHHLFLSLQTAVQGLKDRGIIPLTATRPYLFHITRLARELYENITGDFPRRNPLDEGSVTEFISSLKYLRSIHSLIFQEDKPDPAGASFVSSTHKPARNLSLRSCAYIMTLSHAALVIALHRELVHRASILSTHASGTPSNNWAAERLNQWGHQVREIADITVLDVARALRSMPSLPQVAHGHRGVVVAWAEFCLDEADAAGSLSPERATAVETISEALKLIGYSWPIPTGLVERLDAYIDMRRPSLPALLEDPIFFDLFPAALDNDWVMMFTAAR